MNESCRRKDCGYRMVCVATRDFSECSMYDTAKASPFIVAVGPIDRQKPLFPVYPDNERIYQEIMQKQYPKPKRSKTCLTISG